MTTQPRTVPPTTWALNEVLRVCVVLDESHCAAAGRSVTQTVADAVAGGATMIQVRAKNADDREFYFTDCARAQLSMGKSPSWSTTGWICSLRHGWTRWRLLGFMWASVTCR